MKYNFDKIIERKGTNSIKWEHMNFMFAENDLLPLWVADMDFQCPPPVIKALKKRAEHGIFGYSTHKTEEYFFAVKSWMQRRHGWDVQKEWLIHTPGVVNALSICIQTFTKPGEKVIIQRPVYYPFTNIVVNNNRIVLNNSLIYKDYYYKMNFSELEKMAADPLCKLMLLCSPHNPVGRVWAEDELAEVGRICKDNGVILVSDEIHSDLILGEKKHIPFIKINKDFEDFSIICTSPSKSFNLAGLHTSNIFIPNEKLRKEFLQTQEEKNFSALTNAFGITAAQAAYNFGEDWLEQVLKYIKNNIEYVDKFCTDELQGVRLIKPEGTYLAWLDFRELGFSKEELTRVILRKAKVALDEGYFFGEEGIGFERINCACPRKILEKCMLRIQKALN